MTVDRKFHGFLSFPTVKPSPTPEFDLLWCDGEDLRERTLIDQKKHLCEIIPQQLSVLLYANHIERDGIEFFRLACERDLEGFVGKLPERSPW